MERSEKIRQLGFTKRSTIQACFVLVCRLTDSPITYYSHIDGVFILPILRFITVTGWKLALYAKKQHYPVVSSALISWLVPCLLARIPRLAFTYQGIGIPAGLDVTRVIFNERWQDIYPTSLQH